MVGLRLLIRELTDALKEEGHTGFDDCSYCDLVRQGEEVLRNSSPIPKHEGPTHDASPRTSQ